MRRPWIAIVILVVGIFLMLEGSKLYTVSFMTDLVMLVVGVVLTISYLPLIGDCLEKRFGGNSIVTYLPILATLGAGLLWQSVSRALALMDRVIFVGVGIVLIVSSMVYLRRAMKLRPR
ncbi:MAG: hypothetical protein QW835_02075 [Candidatus Hadarchaeum sp.]|uniref:hypothetical protein n=1 Tax=Candidatus Hadarchaeum sp. TaxID=2883567 RepID=UPI0031781026